MNIILSNASPDPIYDQIKQQIIRHIITGILAEGEALPSIRRLARELQVSVITTKRAYDDLEKEGFIDTVNGKGSYVSMQNEDFLREKRRRIVEEKLQEAVKNAKLLDINKDDLIKMMDILYEEKSDEDS